MSIVLPTVLSKTQTDTVEYCRLSKFSLNYGRFPILTASDMSLRPRTYSYSCANESTESLVINFVAFMICL